LFGSTEISNTLPNFREDLLRTKNSRCDTLQRRNRTHLITRALSQPADTPTHIARPLTTKSRKYPCRPGTNNCPSSRAAARVTAAAIKNPRYRAYPERKTYGEESESVFSIVRNSCIRPHPMWTNGESYSCGDQKPPDNLRDPGQNVPSSTRSWSDCSEFLTLTMTLQRP
jgi:hypothetical protein